MVSDELDFKVKKADVKYDLRKSFFEEYSIMSVRMKVNRQIDEIMTMTRLSRIELFCDRVQPFQDFMKS